MDFTRLFPQPKLIEVSDTHIDLTGRPVAVSGPDDALVAHGAALASRDGAGDARSAVGLPVSHGGPTGAGT